MKTHISSKFLRLCSAGLIALAGAACSSEPAQPAQPIAAVSGVAERITKEIGDAACDSSAQCRTLAYGHKACGGPERYVAYSTKRSDSARLGRLGAELAEQRRASDAREGMMSTCSMVIDPGAVCNAGRCVLQSQGQGGAPLAR